MKSETKIRAFGLSLIFISSCYFAGYVKDNEFHSPAIVHSYETDENIFYNGEVLLPDYVHQDTLVVINASFLNEMIIEDRYEVASDGDIYDLLQEGCVNIADYQDYIKVVAVH